MAKFYVGQRVRIKWSVNCPELSGTEGTVCEVGDECIPPVAGEVPVAPDAWGTCFDPLDDDGGYFCPLEYQLEPITDANDLVSWESMRDLWVPEHMREDA